MSDIDVTQEMVRSRLIYVRETGLLVWLRRPRDDFDDANTWAVWNARYAGFTAGSLNAINYRNINIFGKMRRASRLTWLYHHGVWPDVIDHIDGNPANDTIENLRNVTQAVNCRNRAIPSTNKTGVHGVYRDGDLIRAQINFGGKRIYLGSFPSIAAAALARVAAENRLGFHPNHGRAGNSRD